MRKITYSLHFGIILPEHGVNIRYSHILTDFLEKYAIKSEKIDIDLENIENHEFLMVFEEIPIKIKLFITNNSSILTSNKNIIKKLDIIGLVVDLLSPDSISQLSNKKYAQIKKVYSFQGTSLLIGMNLTKNSNQTETNMMSEEKMIEKAKELGLIYCYKISNTKSDLLDLFHRILEDFSFNFKISGPELYELAKSYGRTLSSNKNLRLTENINVKK